MIVLNKADLVSPAQLEAVRALVTRLNPDAEIITSEFSRVPVGRQGAAKQCGRLGTALCLPFAAA